jgi:small subunit ribosomal protein S9
MEEKIPRFYGTGKRKTSVARVFLLSGTGEITINGRRPMDYFHRESFITNFKAPLVVTKTDTKYNVKAHVSGGGISSQSDAVRLGISRALLVSDITHKGLLKQNGFLTRDARKKERKKYGQRGARARFQFTKR